MHAVRFLSFACCAAMLPLLPAHAGALLYVASGSDNSVITIDTASNTQVGAAIPVGIDPLAPVASPDGARVYVESAADAHVYLIDTRARAVASVVVDTTPTGRAQGIVLSADGSRLYLLETGSIAVMDTASGKVLGRVDIGGAGDGDTLLAAPSHDGRALYVAQSASHALIVIDTHTLAASAPIALGDKGDLRGIALSADDRSLYLSDSAGGFTEYNTLTQARQSTMLAGSLDAIALPADGAHVYATSSGANCLFTYDVTSQTVASAGFGTANQCRGIALAPDGSSLYLGYEQGGVWSLIALDPRTDLENKTVLSGIQDPRFGPASVAPATIYPQPGLWSNPAESGRGFSIEVQGANLVLIADAFDAVGAARWFFSAGPYDATSGTYQGTLDGYGNGQCLGCAYQLPTYTRAAGGSIRAVFTSPTAGKLYFDGGSTAIEKITW